MSHIRWVPRQNKLENWVVVYHESIKRELKIRGIHECRCDERLQTKTKEFTRLSYTGLVVELEHRRGSKGQRFFVYYESIKRELERRLIYEYRYFMCDCLL